MWLLPLSVILGALGGLGFGPVGAVLGALLALLPGAALAWSSTAGTRPPLALSVQARALGSAAALVALCMLVGAGIGYSAGRADRDIEERRSIARLHEAVERKTLSPEDAAAQIAAKEAALAARTDDSAARETARRSAGTVGIVGAILAAPLLALYANARRSPRFTAQAPA
jgi:hypothetical protein